MYRHVFARASVTAENHAVFSPAATSIEMCAAHSLFLLSDELTLSVKPLRHFTLILKERVQRRLKETVGATDKEKKADGRE